MELGSLHEVAACSEPDGLAGAGVRRGLGTGGVRVGSEAGTRQTIYP